MSALIDARPGGLDCFYRPGDPFRLDITWPAGSLAGRTFTSTLGAASLGVSVLGDVMTLTLTAAQTTAAGLTVSDWKLTDTTPADDVTLLVGRWAGDNDAASTISTTVTVSSASGAAVVTVVGPPVLGQGPLIFWQHPVAQTLPSGVWTPVAWNALLSSVPNAAEWTTYVPASTTIAAGSNGAVLPVGTINVVSTTGFAAATSTAPRYLVVRISGTDRVVMYTGMSGGTQFTGCTLGVGTLATGQAIAQANVELVTPLGAVGAMIAELAWASNGTGGRWTRLRAVDALGPGIHLNGGTGFAAAIASTDPLIRSVAQEQPIPNPAQRFRIEGHQTSGGPLDSPIDQAAAPRLVIF